MTSRRLARNAGVPAARTFRAWTFWISSVPGNGYSCLRRKPAQAETPDASQWAGRLAAGLSPGKRRRSDTGPEDEKGANPV